MAKAAFSPSKAISSAWTIVKKRVWFYAAVAAFVLLLPQVFSALFGGGRGAGSAMYTILLLLLNIVLTLGFMNLALESVGRKKVTFETLFARIDRFLDFFIAYILVAIMVSIGLVLLVLPGLYIALRVQFFAYFILEKDMKAVEAIKASFAITKGHEFSLVGLWVFQVLIAILGFLALFVGILVAYPVSVIAHAWAYKKLSK